MSDSIIPLSMVRVGNDVLAVVHRFSDLRAIALLDGLYVLIDGTQLGSTTTWELSGRPARPGEEQRVLDELVAASRDTTTERRS